MGDSEYTIEYIIKAKIDDFKAGMSQVSEAFYQAVGSVNDLDTKTKALVATISALDAKMVSDSLSAFAKYEDSMYGMAATVGRVGGTIEEAMEGIRQTTANGLLSETDSARAMNNLTAYGYTVQEATQLIQALTISTEAHGKRTQDVADNVIQLTEGLKRQSSLMVKSQGYTETLSQVQDAYAQSLGKTKDQLTDAERRQAEYNYLIQDSVDYMAVADAYNNSYSASVQRLDNAMEDLKVAFGQALAPIATWIANAIAWVVANKEVIVTALGIATAIIGPVGIVFALSKLIPALVSAIKWFAGLSAVGKGLVGVFAALAGVAALVATFSAIDSLAQDLGDVAVAAGDASGGIDDMAGSVGGAGGAVRDLSKDLAKLERQYKDELKQIENRHKETIDRLTKQIQDANVDYRRAIDERNAEFEVTQAKEEAKHQEKVDALMEQINFLQRYNNKYNRQKLTNLQLALERENNLYKKQTQAAKAELDLQNENDRQAYEEKRSELQTELDTELEFMNRHREDLLAVQDWILEDEIDSLKRRHEEQIASYAEQAVSAGIGGTNIGTALSKGVTESMQNWFNQHAKDYTDMGNLLGIDFSEGIVNGLIDGFQRIGSKIKGATLFTVNGQSMSVGDFMALYHRVQAVTPSISGFVNLIKSALTGDWSDYQTSTGYATGGYTGQGGVNEVAGIVHKGEYVLPQEMVDQNTGTPKSLGNTYVINVSGTFATSASERRRVADQIVAAINQNNKSRLEASWQ